VNSATSQIEENFNHFYKSHLLKVVDHKHVV